MQVPDGKGGTTSKIGGELFFPNNGLTITNVDIQAVEPVDQRTRDSLQKAVSLAIEITTKVHAASLSLPLYQLTTDFITLS